MANWLAEDFAAHQGQTIYIRYLHQLSTANLKTKVGTLMVCEGLLNLFGTSSEEIAARAKQESEEYYLPKLNELAAANEQLASSNAQQASSIKQLTSFNKQLTSQIDHLENLLRKNNISFK